MSNVKCNCVYLKKRLWNIDRTCLTFQQHREKLHQRSRHKACHLFGRRNHTKQGTGRLTSILSVLSGNRQRVFATPILSLCWIPIWWHVRSLQSNLNVTVRMIVTNTPLTNPQRFVIFEYFLFLSTYPSKFGNSCGWFHHDPSQSKIDSRFDMFATKCDLFRVLLSRWYFPLFYGTVFPKAISLWPIRTMFVRRYVWTNSWLWPVYGSRLFKNILMCAIAVSWIYHTFQILFRFSPQTRVLFELTSLRRLVLRGCSKENISIFGK